LTEVKLNRAGAIAYREALPDGEPDPTAVLCLHGFPETSYMWRHVLSAAADAGRRAVAMDRPGSGRSEPDPPATWARQVEAVERFVDALGLPPVVLVVHDWGGLIGLRWACDHPERVKGLVISSSGFFSDGKWHGMAEGLRAEGTGEQLLESIDREGFGAMMRSLGSGFDDETIDEYWISFGSDAGRAAVLEMYRSGDFEQLVPYEGKLAELGVPTLILWGESDAFAPVAGAHRFLKEIPGAELRIVDSAGHFLYSDAPEESAAAVAGFLGTVTPGLDASARSD
jgi:pimeloyl-ACP methyl ester carboxylesterase